jgi:hypothetical protein
VRDEKTQKVDEIMFSVRNAGAAAKGFTETVHSFISIEYSGPPPASLSGTATVPINEYLPQFGITGDSTGLLCTVRGSHNRTIEAALTEELYQRAKQLGALARMGVFSVFEFRYTDIIGEAHKVFYRVSDFGGTPLDDVEAYRLP